MPAGTSVFTSAASILLISVTSFAQSGPARRLPSILDPVQRIFLNCRATYSCAEAANTLSSGAPGVKITVFNQEGESLPSGKNIELIRSEDLNPQSRLSPAFFFRDLGLFGFSEFIELPYSNESLGTTGAEFFRQNKNELHLATFRFSRSYISDAVEQKAEKQYPNDPYLQIYISQSLNQSGPYEGASMGGNHLVFPDGLIAVGVIQKRTQPPFRASKYPGYLESYFKNRGPILKIPIPGSLLVGHIDEVFALIPNHSRKTGECDFAILYADPVAFESAARKAKLSLDDLGASGDTKEFSKIVAEGLQTLQSHYSKKCSVRAIGLPELPLKRGVEFFSAPVNGLSVGAAYFYAAAGASDGGGSETTQARKRALAASIHHVVSDALKTAGIRAIPIRLGPALTSGGGLHCATQEVRMKLKRSN